MRIYFPINGGYREPDVDRIKRRVTANRGDNVWEKIDGVEGVRDVRLVDGRKHLECMPDHLNEPETLMIRLEWGAGPYEIMDDQLLSLLHVMEDEFLPQLGKDQRNYGTLSPVEFIIRE